MFNKLIMAGIGAVAVLVLVPVQASAQTDKSCLNEKKPTLAQRSACIDSLFIGKQEPRGFLPSLGLNDKKLEVGALKHEID